MNNTRSYPNDSEVETFVGPTLFSGLYSHHVECCNNSRDNPPSSLPNILKTLLLNLAVTDVGVGLIVQPSQYTFLLVNYSYKMVMIVDILPFMLVLSGSLLILGGLTSKTATLISVKQSSLLKLRIDIAQ